MTNDFMAKGRIGKAAVWAGIVLVTTLLMEVAFAFAVRGDSVAIEGNPTLTVLAGVLSLTFTLSVPLSLILGVVAGFKEKDWRAMKTLGILYAATFVLFLIGEFSFPH